MTSPTANDFAARFETLIDTHWRGNQRAAARDLPASQATISRLLAGRRRPSCELLVALAERTGVDLMWLLAGKPERKPVPDENDPRRPFYEEFLRLGGEAAAGLFASVPELYGLVLVPIWETDQPDLQASFFNTRDDQPASPRMVMRSAQQLTRAWREMADNGMEVTTAIINALHRKRQELQALERMIAQREQQLTWTDDTEPTSHGDVHRDLRKRGPEEGHAGGSDPHA